MSYRINIFFLFFLFPFAFSSSHYSDYEGFQVIRANPMISDQSEALNGFSQKFDSKLVQIWKGRPDLKGPMDFFVGPTKLDEVRSFLKKSGIEFEILVSDYGSLMREHISTTLLNEPEVILQESDFNVDKFHPFESITTYLQLLAKNHPQFVKLGSLGKTFQGRDQHIITLGYQNGTSSKPALLVDAGIHAREWIAPSTALHFIHAFVNDPKFHRLLKDIDVHIVPVLNPDGYVYSWTKDRLWRKTRSGPRKADPELCPAEDIHEYEDEQHHCYGTDGNRNFPFRWGINGTNNCPCGETFRGDSALSEPETRNLAQFIRSHKSTIKAWWILHTYSAWIAYDKTASPEHNGDKSRVAHSMAKVVSNSGKDKYRVLELEYLCPGCSLDFGHSQDIKYVYLMELTNGSYKGKYYGFVFPEEAVNGVAKSLLPALQILADEVGTQKI